MRHPKPSRRDPYSFFTDRPVLSVFIMLLLSYFVAAYLVPLMNRGERAKAERALQLAADHNYPFTKPIFSFSKQVGDDLYYKSESEDFATVRVLPLGEVYVVFQGRDSYKVDLERGTVGR